MRKIVFTLLVFTGLTACKNLKEEVKLPKVKSAEIKELYNHSQAYIFYDTNEKDSTLLNRKNLIINTNWVIHADARLSLKNLVPKLNLLHQKRIKKTIHSKTGMKNYFSVLDLAQQKLAFIDYSTITYKHPDEHSKFYIKKMPAFHMKQYTLTINFDHKNEITVDGNLIAGEELVDFLNQQIDFAAEGKKTLVYLNFDQRLTFEQYLNDYLLVSEIAKDAVKIADEQFIYDYDKLPDCNCKL